MRVSNWGQQSHRTTHHWHGHSRMARLEAASWDAGMRWRRTISMLRHICLSSWCSSMSSAKPGTVMLFLPSTRVPITFTRSTWDERKRVSGVSGAAQREERKGGGPNDGDKCDIGNSATDAALILLSVGEWES